MSSGNTKGPRNVAAVVALLLAVLGGFAAPGTAAEGKSARAEVPSPLPPTLDELKSATYTGIGTTPITLRRGLYEGEPFVPGGASRQRVTLLDSITLTGDLDGDGNDDALVFLSEENGGTGTNLYMAVMGRSKGKIVTIATLGLGDRIGVRSIRIDKEQITLELLQPGPKDPACCPSELVSRSWTVERSGLVERMGKRRPGTLKIATLAGVEWRFRGFSPQLEGPGGDTPTLFFEKDHIGGSTGCNRYTGTLTTTKVPGELSLKASKSSNRECGAMAMGEEDTYLAALRRTVRYGFYLGDLTLSWQKKDGSLGLMRFAPGKAPAK